MDQRGFRVVQIGDVVSKGFAKQDVPVERLAIPYQRQQVASRQRVRDLHSGGTEDRRDDVDPAHQIVVPNRFDHARPTEHQRLADPPLVRRLLGSRRVIGRIGTLDPTVIADVNDQRVFAKPLVLDPLQQLAAGLIKPLTHRVILGDERGLDQLEVFVEQPLRRVVGRVGQEWRVP